MKKNVGNAGFIEVVDHMGNDLSVVNAARVSFGKRKDTFDEKDTKLMNYLAKHEHHSPFRHAYVQFHFKAPEFVARQLYKHIVGSDYAFKDQPWNEISGRYVKFDLEMWSPDSWRVQSSDNKQASDGDASDEIQIEADRIYSEALAKCEETYESLIAMGISKEQARAVVPISFYTEWYWTASLQAVYHMVRLRNHEGAQQETRDFAVALDEMMRKLYPNAWEALSKTK